MLKKPTKCKTPARDVMFYKLTAADVNNLTNLVKEANAMLAYYVNMPENKTGELYASDGARFDLLCEEIADLQATVNDINLADI